MRALLALAAVLLSGCIYCGPTVYHLSGVTAWTPMQGSWDAARAEAGLRAMGASPWGTSGPCSLGGRGEGWSAEANGCTTGRVDVRVSYDAQPPAEGSRGEVEEAAQRMIAAHDAEVAGLVAAFQNATGWPRAGAISWDEGILHGDC